MPQFHVIFVQSPHHRLLPTLMASSVNPEVSSTKHKFILSRGLVLKSLAILALSIFMLYHIYGISFLLPIYQNSRMSAPTRLETLIPAANLSHLVFGIAGSNKTLGHKKPYLESWWRPNVTRGYLFLDVTPGEEFFPWPPTLPLLKVSENITTLKFHHKIIRPIPARIARTVLETVRQGDSDVKWYVMADDDTIFILENLLDVLAKYDHTKYYYIGTNSEFIKSNFDFAFEMAYGGAGFVLSAPLAEALARVFDECLERYADLWTSDMLIHQCLGDIGVDLTHEPGFHQVDLVGDITGFLASQPQYPFVSFHHLDTITPIFPLKTQSESVRHLLKAAKADHSRLLQQTICYHRPTNWTFSIAWGYTAQIYEMVLPRFFLKRPLETFKPWSSRTGPPFYMFNTRWVSHNPCDTPHGFFLTSVERNDDNNNTISIYKRALPRKLPTCMFTGNHSADHVKKIKVVTPITRKKEGIECCDVKYKDGKASADVKFRNCKRGELLA